jgi:hypothetical protein
MCMVIMDVGKSVSKMLRLYLLRNSATSDNDQSGAESFLYLGNMRGTMYGELQPQQLHLFREAPDGEDRSTYLIDN